MCSTWGYYILQDVAIYPDYLCLLVLEYFFTDCPGNSHSAWFKISKDCFLVFIAEKLLTGTFGGSECLRSGEMFSSSAQQAFRIKTNIAPR